MKTAEQEYYETVRALEKKKARQKAIMAAINYLRSKKVSGVYSYITGVKYGN
uniref:Uncharacterized protein n=1 Tax=viral metagenome TaxID=1070528 RepID=A0A6M3LZC4_9ZZZZ